MNHNPMSMLFKRVHLLMILDLKEENIPIEYKTSYKSKYTLDIIGTGM